MNNSKFIKNKFKRATKSRNVSPVDRLETGAQFSRIKKPHGITFKTLTTTGLRGYDFDRRLTQSAMGSQRPVVLSRHNITL